MSPAIEVLAYFGFGCSGGALILTHCIIYSSIFPPPKPEAGAIANVKVILLRAVLLAPAFLVIFLGRPLRLIAYPPYFLGPLLGLIFVFVVLIFGGLYVLPRFMTLRLVTQDYRKH